MLLHACHCHCLKTPISLHPDRVTRHHFVDPHSTKFHNQAWTPPCPSLPPQTPIFFGIHIYLHIFTHISEFLCISLHTGVPQSFIKVCPCWPPYSKKYPIPKKFHKVSCCSRKWTQSPIFFTVICNMGLDEMFKWPKQFLNPRDFPGRFMAVIYVYTYIHIYIYTHLYIYNIMK